MSVSCILRTYLCLKPTSDHRSIDIKVPVHGGRDISYVEVEKIVWQKPEHGRVRHKHSVRRMVIGAWWMHSITEGEEFAVVIAWGTVYNYM